MPAIAASQDANGPSAESAPPQGIQEIVVTAQRREENLQKVPVSVTALSGADLAARAIVDSTDIAKLVPALKYNAYSPSTTVYNLRGVSQNDYSDQLEPPVAVYQDDSYLSSMATAGFPLFDIERVEVLRGPQGTLFGRNATGGAIQFISRKPTNSFSLDASTTWFSDGGYSIEVGAGGPVTDTLAVRFAIDRVQRDGFVKSNNPAIGDAGETNQFAGRVQLLWKPTPDLKIQLRAMRSKDDNSIAGGTYTYTPAVPADHGRGVAQDPTNDFWGTGPGVDPNGYVKPASYGLYENNNNVPSIFNRTIQAYTGRIDWSVGDVTIISITDYQRMSKFYQEDCDGTPLNGCVFAPRTKLRQFSQELRAEGNSGDLRWVAGVNYIDIDGHYQSHAEYNLIALDYFSTGDSDYHIRTKSPSIFAQGTYDLTDKLKFTVGARYTRDKKTDDYRLDFTSVSGGVVDNQLVTFNPSTNPSEARKRYNLYSGKVQFDYSPSENFMLFAGVTRGTKSGNFSAPVSAPVVVSRLPHGPEVLWDYEAGIKSKFLDNRLRINASAFYYDYQNYQAFSLIDLVQTISNHDAWVYGGELEITAVPVEGLNISGGVSYLKSKVKDIGLPDGTTTDSRLPQAPRWSGNASISYTLPVAGGDLTARLDGTFTSGFCFSVVCAPVEREKAYQTLDGSLSYKFSDFTLTAFAKNITGEKYRTYALDVSSLGFLESIYTRPRYYGVTLSVNYGR
ncbi:TonB-dependent receptor [Sphingobium sp. ZW T5_29]|uniref:TonB-dependent receptor n=1 Tax=Sphingobium sp. ZW T5_29 TaxID=3378077 RepID=UPI003853C7F0